MKKWIREKGLWPLISSPGKTVGEAMEKKQWLSLLLILMVIQAFFTFVTYPTVKNERARLIRESSLSDHLSEEQLSSLDQYSGLQHLIDSGFSGVILIISLLISTAFIYLFYKIADAAGFYVHFFSGVVQASLIPILLGGLVQTLLIWWTGKLSYSLSFALLLPKSAMHSFIFYLFNQFNLISIWYFVVLALGIAYYSHMTVKKSLAVMFSYFFFKVLIISSFSALLSKLIRF